MIPLHGEVVLVRDKKAFKGLAPSSPSFHHPHFFLETRAPSHTQAHPDDAGSSREAAGSQHLGFVPKKGTGLCSIFYFGFRVPADFAISSLKNNESWGLHRLVCVQVILQSQKFARQSSFFRTSQISKKLFFEKLA